MNLCLNCKTESCNLKQALAGCKVAECDRYSAGEELAASDALLQRRGERKAPSSSALNSSRLTLAKPGSAT